MKTRTFVHTSIALLASGVLAATAFAGASPQYWQQMEKLRAERAAKEQASAAAAPTCDGCRTTPMWADAARDPAGKGAPRGRVVGSAHACSGCVGTRVITSGKITAVMQHGAACTARLCCK